MEKQIVIIDGNSLVNRAYYAMQRPMITKEGIYTQGIYGFLNMLEKIKKDYEPAYITVTFDLKAPTFRHKEYEEYKAGRKKMPFELSMQMPILKDILKAMNIKIEEMEGFEADDLIGTISRVGEEEGLSPLIVTGDKDALQLASDKTKVLITKKGVSNFALYDEKAFISEYGFTPTEFIDCKGIMGDSSDNIPGVPGIGEKGASKLIIEYGSIENIYEHIEDITPKGTKTKLEENKALAFMSKKLATINRYVPIDINFDEYKLEEPNYDELIALYKKLEFNSFLKKLNIPSAQSKEAELKNYPLNIIDDTKMASILDEKIKKTETIGLKVFSDNDHTAIPTVSGIGIFVGDEVYYVNQSATDAFNKAIEILTSYEGSIYGHDIKNEIYNLLYLGDKEFNIAFDTAIAEYIIDSSRSDYSLETLAAEVLQVNLNSEESEVKEETQVDMFAGLAGSLQDHDDLLQKEGSEAATWFAALNALREIQEKKIKEEDLKHVLDEAELPLIPVMAFMEYVGFKLDKEYLGSFGEMLKANILDLENQIYNIAGEEFNIKSPKQLGVILFEKLGLPIIKKTKSGYATGAEILEKLQDDHPIITLILEYRKLTKLNSTYVEGLMPLVAEDGKIHASFNQTVTTTGRISSSNPNMQNIPVKDELGKKIRGAFIPSSDEFTLVGADYSQIELRVLAHMSGDEALIEAFNSGQDIHRATAARVMGIAEDEVTPLQRSSAKAINFGVIYGMSAFGLSNDLDISRKQAENYINDYFAKHPKVKIFMDKQIDIAKKEGYVTTILGRKRYIKEIHASNFNVRNMGERLAMNTPIQGSAADIIKLAMIKVYNALKGMKSRLLLQVHDELIIEAHKEEIEEVKKLLVENMESAMKLVVDLKVDLNTGDNWLELK